MTCVGRAPPVGLLSNCTGILCRLLSYAFLSRAASNTSSESSISPLPPLGLRFFLRGDLLKRESYLINFSQQVTFSGLNSKGMRAFATTLFSVSSWRSVFFVSSICFNPSLSLCCLICSCNITRCRLWTFGMSNQANTTRAHLNPETRV